ncbi:MAG: YidC/Oxa1 family membrane protein insertase, partial [Pseudohongiellaceae bacterium]
MDLPKFALYTALAVVTYLMLLAWQDDYPPNVGSNDGSTPIAEFSASAVSNVASSDIPSDLPSDLPSSTPAANDQTLATNTDIPTTTASVSASSSQLINVITDTFNISIDPVGGDIVYLALPKYLKQLEVAGDPFVILERTAGREYVAQSGLIGTNGVDSNGRATYRVNSNSFEMTESQNTLNVDLLLTTEAGVEVTKRFTFNRNSYLFDVSFIVNNRSGNSWQANPFGQIKRDAFDDPSDAGGFGRTYLGFVSTAAEEDPYIEYEFDDIDDGRSTVDVTGGWMAFSQHYFLTAWIPDPATLNRFSTRKNNANQYYGEFTAAAFNVEPGSTSTATMQYYAGPKDQYVLAEISENLDLTIDYSFLWFLAAPIYW